MGAAGLGNKAPRYGRKHRTKWCPLCPPNTKLDEFHLVVSCGAVEEERRVTGLGTVLNLGLLKGTTLEEVYYNLLNGRSMSGKKVMRSEWLQVGRSLRVLLDKFMSLW